MSSISKKITNQKHYDDMLLALLPLIVCACVMHSVRVLLICGTAVVTARIVDVAVSVVRRRELDPDDKSSTVAALTFCMMLPVSIPLYVVIMSVALTTLVGKHAFGGKDVYPFNLAALEMCVAAVNWPNEVFKAVKPFAEVNFWTGATRSTVSSSLQLKTGGLPYISTLDLLLGNHAGAMGSGFIIITVAVAVFLLVSKRITWHIPVTFIATCCAIAAVFPRIYGISRIDSLKYEILTSAVIFYAVFMLNEPATTPKKPQAKIIFGVLSGILTMIFRYYGSFEIGGCFALLLVNATEGYWDRLFTKDSDKETDKKAEKQVVETPADKKEDKKLYRKEEKPVSKENKKEYKAPQPAGDKSIKESKDKKDISVTSTLSIISRAEDDIDQVEFSTQTIDVREALKAFDEKYNREGR